MYKLFLTGILALTLLIPFNAKLEDLIFNINIKNHVFIPSEITIPAGVKVTIVVNNQDKSIEEFESFELRREKIIPANSSRNIIIGPLKPGSYNFFGEFHPKTAQGKIIVK